MKSLKNSYITTINFPLKLSATVSGVASIKFEEKDVSSMDSSGDSSGSTFDIKLTALPLYLLHVIQERFTAKEFNLLRILFWVKWRSAVDAPISHLRRMPGAEK